MRWSNIPLPEGHLACLALALGLHRLFPRRLFRSARPARALGWPLLLLSVLGAAWAVSAAQNVSLERPARLVLAGPYRYSRNPMYVAWTGLYVAAALLANSRWPLLLFPALAAHLHYCVILREEQALAAAFGDEYRRYRDRIRRYF
jgi:protein-S-isoprenylcysteine O-methyltransferase Ste14